MSKPKSIRPSELDPSNRRLLAAAQQAGLCPDEIIRKSLQAAYGRLSQGGNERGKRVAGGKNHQPLKAKTGAKPSAAASPSALGGEDGRGFGFGKSGADI